MGFIVKRYDSRMNHFSVQGRIQSDFYNKTLEFDLTPTMTIADRIKNVSQDIKDLGKKYCININELKLLAVSKTHPAKSIQAAYDAGITEFGESYLQEAVQKITELAHLPLTWHFIGPIQSNKTRLIAENFDWVQSVDREKILNRLNDQRPDNKPPINLCIQVNAFNEPQKSGVTPDKLDGLLELAASLPHIALRGLMVIPPKTDLFDNQLKQFQSVKRLFDRVQKSYPMVDTLSMGMSGDLQAAIVSGSTMVRIGTSLFGPRRAR